MFILPRRQAICKAVPKNTIRVSNGVASSRWEHCKGLPYTWAANKNTIEQCPAIQVDLVDVRKKETKTEGGEVLQQAPHAGLESEEISGRLVIGNRGGLNLVAEMQSRISALENLLAQKDAWLAPHKNKNIQKAQTILQQAQVYLQQAQKDLQQSQINASELKTRS